MINGKQKEQACDLYAQTDMTRTQIANEVGIDRRTLNKWIRTGNWERLKLTAQHLPSLMAERCYHLFGMHCNHLLAERNYHNPLTLKDVDVLYRLTCTIEKLGKRAAITESMEIMTFYAEHLRKKDKKLADATIPHMETYLEQRAGIWRTDFYAPDQTGYKGTIPDPTDEEKKVFQAEHEADMQEEQEEYEERCKARREALDAAGLIYEDEDEDAEEITMADVKECVRQEAIWVKEVEEELAAELAATPDNYRDTLKNKPTQKKAAPAKKRGTNMTPAQKRHKKSTRRA